METERYRLALFSGSDEAHLRQQIAAAGYQDGDRLTVDLQAPCRTYLVYRGQEDWCRQTDPTARLPVCRVGKPGKTLFLFPGNGIHQKNMLATLRQVSPYFEQTLGELAALAKPYTPVELLDETQENPLVNQLRVYASELAIAGFWTRLGCPPDAVIGHSMGEYAAAVCAGYLSPADGFFLLIQCAGGGHGLLPRQSAASAEPAVQGGRDPAEHHQSRSRGTLQRTGTGSSPACCADGAGSISQAPSADAFNGLSGWKLYTGGACILGGTYVPAGAVSAGAGYGAEGNTGQSHRPGGIAGAAEHGDEKPWESSLRLDSHCPGRKKLQTVHSGCSGNSISFRCLHPTGRIGFGRQPDYERMI